MTLGRKKFRDLTKKLTDQEFLSQCQKSIPDLDVEALKTWLRKRRSQRRKVSEHSCAEWIRDNKKKSSNAALYGQMLKIVSAKEKCCSDDGRALKRQRLKLQQRQKQQKQQKQDHTSLPGNHFNCAICLSDDCNANTLVLCNGSRNHRFCQSCIGNYIRAQIDMNISVITCPMRGPCEAPFWDHQLGFLDGETRQRLDKVRMRQSTRDAKTDKTVECPFCDYQEDYPLVKEETQFRCRNVPECGKVCCRRCNAAEHPNKTCKQAEVDRFRNTDGHIVILHVVEEAMSNAVVRNCRGCNVPFVKLDGYNKMRCNRCFKYQCYVCKKEIRGYDHYEGINKCPLYDDPRLHRLEVERAQNAAIRKLRTKHPNIPEEMLRVQVPDPQPNTSGQLPPRRIDYW